MYNQFYKFLDSFKQFNPSLIEAIGTGFGAIYEVFDRGGDLNYMGDGVVDITLSDGTKFNVSLDDYDTEFTTAEGNGIQVLTSVINGILTVNFKRSNKYGAYGYVTDNKERDPVIMEGIIAVVRAFAEYNPNVKEIKFYGLEDMKDLDINDNYKNNMLQLVTDIVENLPRNNRGQVEDILLDTIKKNIPQNFQKAIADIYYAVASSIDPDNYESDEVSEYLNNFKPYMDLLKLVRDYEQLLKKGVTRRDRSYILMIKKRDRNADVSFDGQYYHYKLSPELMEKKASNPDLKYNSRQS